MLIDWTSGGTRWMVTGVFSLILHIIILGALVSSSGVSGSEADAEVPRTEPPKGEEAAKDAAASPKVDATTLADAEKPAPLPEPPRTPETVGSAERGSLEAIGKSFDESSTRLRNAGSSSERKPVAGKKAEARKPPVRKPEKVERRPDGEPADGGKDVGFKWYVVQKGESLTRIARDHGMTPLALAQLNGYKKPLSVRLRVGQKIKVKAP